jgi:peptide deformylase
MALKEIKVYPDPILRKVASRIDKITDEVMGLSRDMLETMVMAHGAGLAANQVGVGLQLIVIEEQVNKKSRPLILINPEIVLTEEEDTLEEGCLSIPGFYEFVKRSKRVRVRALNLKEQVVELDCEDHLARALQHEIDHLKGALFIDHLSAMKKEFFKKKFMRPKK